jgi:hypothetical protein
MSTPALAPDALIIATCTAWEVRRAYLACPQIVSQALMPAYIGALVSTNGCSQRHLIAREEGFGQSPAVRVHTITQPCTAMMIR